RFGRRLAADCRAEGQGKTDERTTHGSLRERSAERIEGNPRRPRAAIDGSSHDRCAPAVGGSLRSIGYVPLARPRRKERTRENFAIAGQPPHPARIGAAKSRWATDPRRGC